MAVSSILVLYRSEVGLIIFCRVYFGRLSYGPIIASTFILIHLIDTVNEFKEKAQGWESYQDLSQCRFIKFIFLQHLQFVIKSNHKTIGVKYWHFWSEIESFQRAS